MAAYRWCASLELPRAQIEARKKARPRWPAHSPFKGTL